jgi:arsenate reductase-like glutaredoxin family protein
VFVNWKSVRSEVFERHVVGRVDDWFMAQFHEIVEANLQRNPPSDDELRRIALQTGVDPDELVEKYRHVRVNNAQRDHPDAFDHET